MVQFITGHNYLNQRNFLVYGKEGEVNPKCELCDFNYDQTLQHMTGDCPALVGPRLDVFGLHTIEPPFNFPIETIIRFLKLAEVESLSFVEISMCVNQTS